MDDSQAPVFAWLADPATHAGAAVKRIDTHAASVFLAGDRAFKVKRAVRFPFLDYSTLQRRKDACEAEIAINRPFAPDLYRRVVAIARMPDGRFELDGDGVPIEWAVEMRRFDENATLDRLADTGRIDTALAELLGRAVATAHDAAPVVQPAPWIDALADYVEQNDAAFGAAPQLFPRGEADALTRASRAAHARIRRLLVERGRRNLIRRGHGDLHLGNIVLRDGQPVPFDAIEFDALVASGDVLYDLAFLLMDLSERGLPAAANIVLNRYLAACGRVEDLDALAALPLFLSLRAAIRAKVTAAQLARTAPVPSAKAEAARAAERRPVEANARRYFDFARSLIAPPPPVLIAVGGLSGTGKSLLARELAPAIAPLPGAVVIRSDVERKTLLGKDEYDPLGEQGYAPPVTARVYASIADKARRVLAAGHSAIVDAVYARPQQRVAIEASAAALGVRFCGMFLTADFATRLARIGTRRSDASDADAAVVRSQENYDLGAHDWERIDASGTAQATLKQAEAAIQSSS
jgi:uncharacterized protein